MCLPKGISMLDPACYMVFSLVNLLYAVYYAAWNVIERKRYLAVESLKEEASKYKMLIHDVLPLGIVIVSQDLSKLEFINNTAVAKLNGNEQLLLEKLQETFKCEPTSAIPYSKILPQYTV